MDYKTIRDRIEDISLSITLILSCKFCLSSAAFWMYSSSCLTDLILSYERKIRGIYAC